MKYSLKLSRIEAADLEYLVKQKGSKMLNNNYDSKLLF